ncbi:DoxX family protein [Roseibacterium sp. SDUM158016]|jgi:putative oxidoreductase|uniref:DoxX family protein n=1 Tax=Roseicyclus sediminis TaxID=2980997 RepID=UPI0021D164AB|nr:DoxX family protein [Roseibacterium sp. SDUM158016]MCU4654885.1 DoxX family protein [Roseibacterium sp. SDUM158016]
MRPLIALHDRIFGTLEATAPWLIPTLARIVFAGTLLVYYWNSGLTKWGSGPFSPDLGAYIQILPRAFEAVGFNPSALGPLATPIVILGTWTEFILPALIVLGLFTRLAAIGMIGFVAVQTWVDIVGHGVSGDVLGAWFDNSAGSDIADQRAFWIFLLVVLVLRGAGPLSLDALLSRQRSADLTPASQPR